MGLSIRVYIYIQITILYIYIYTAYIYIHSINIYIYTQYIYILYIYTVYIGIYFLPIFARQSLVNDLAVLQQTAKESAPSAEGPRTGPGSEVLPLVQHGSIYAWGRPASCTRDCKSIHPAYHMQSKFGFPRKEKSEPN